MHYLTFDLTDNGPGVTTIEALASTSAGQHAAALAEAQQLLAWAWSCFPDTHGGVDDGMDWDHDLQVQVEDGGWHTVALTLVGSSRFVDAWRAAFADALDL
jgi:hypothetical protein